MLKFNLYSASSLLDRQVLQSLQDVLRRVFPEWCHEVYLAEDEEELEAATQLDVYRQSHLYSLLHAEAEKCRPFRRIIYENYLKNLRNSGSQRTPPPFDSECWDGNFTITDHKQDLMLFLSYCTKPTRLEENRVSMHCCNITVEGISSSLLMQTAFLELVENIPFDWGCVRSDDEFDSRNRDEIGQVTGVHLDAALPGLFWINYFGPLYRDAIGIERLQNAPAAWAKTLPHGVVIGMGNGPNEWRTLEYCKRRRAIEKHLGKMWFFSKDEPSRVLSAPKVNTT